MPLNENNIPGNQADENADPLVLVRSILLSEVRDRLRGIERQIESVQDRSQSDDENLRRQLDELLAELGRLHKLAREADNLSRDLKAEIELLQRRAQSDSEGLVARVTPVLGDMIGRSIRDSRDEMAEALGPVMGEAIRVQIRESRDDMAEALYPVIGATVQKAIAEFMRELQRNIDVRFKDAFGPRGMLRMALGRLLGVSASQLTLRDSIPFSIRDVFLIQHDSGLLVAHSHPGNPDATDSDLISAMLTAIRDFAHDSFGRGNQQEQLDEVQYGDQRIIIQNGRTVYLAVVITGIEPEGFHAELHEFVSNLHVKHEKSLRQFTGDPTTVPNLEPRINRFIAETARDTNQPQPISRQGRLILFLGSIVIILCIVLACFYLQFTAALYPLAFPSRTPTVTNTPTFTPTATLTPTATASPSRTPTSTPTSTFTSTAIYTPTKTFTPTSTFTPSVTPTPYKAYAAGNVWTRLVPDPFEPHVEVLFKGTPVTVLASYARWLEVEWTDNTGYHRGWVPVYWITLAESIDPALITPTVAP